MQSVSFSGEREYSAYIGSGAIQLLAGRLSKNVCGTQTVVVTDSGVPERHVSSALAQISAAGLSAHTLVLPAGERGKTLCGMQSIYGFLYRAGVTRSDCIVAVGGGVVGDMAGFAAATYLRGIAFVNVPTTIIAQTDSAYGGKTGVDFEQGKNHIGCFYTPLFVICDTDLLLTLGNEQRLCGMGEVIKYGAIASADLLKNVTNNGTAMPDEQTTTMCVSIKKSFVEGDEHDNGRRRMLNFGHTIGHAIEAASGFAIQHGQAVAYGMLAAAKVGEVLGVMPHSVYQKLNSAALAVGLDTEWESSAAGALPLLSLDKKFNGTDIDFVLLEDIGMPVRKKLSPNCIADILAR